MSADTPSMAEHLYPVTLNSRDRELLRESLEPYRAGLQTQVVDLLAGDSNAATLGLVVMIRRVELLLGRIDLANAFDPETEVPYLVEALRVGPAAETEEVLALLARLPAEPRSIHPQL